MLRFGKISSKRKFDGAKKIIKILDADINSIVILKLVETRKRSKYMNGYLDVRPITLMLLKMSEYVKTFKGKGGYKIRKRILN